MGDEYFFLFKYVLIKVVFWVDYVLNFFFHTDSTYNLVRDLSSSLVEEYLYNEFVFSKTID